MQNHEHDKLESSYSYYICIKNKDHETFKGEIYPMDSDGMLAFESFEDFIMKMEHYMDEHGPQSFQDKRSLSDVTSKSHYVLPNRCKNPVMETGEACRNCYLLAIYSRRNTEWQGAMYCKDELQLEFSNIIDLTNFFAKHA